jgi:bifunctional UDP-N-acetylglucosamine pyrophosphorylase/glucosamine-1-phosphate N-acetyltransferase/UDP-N-acetylglucosamine pyrophosphorylase
MSNTVAIVLAAGKGTRMNSELPKVLVPVCGRPMVEHVLDALDRAGIGGKLVVVGYRGDLVRETLAHRAGVEFVDQPEQLGTGHAVMVCRDKLVGPNGAPHEGAVLVLTGDSPLVQTSSLAAMLDEFARSQPACILGTAIKDDPGSLGRIVRNAAGDFERIVEVKDASPEERAIREVNMSTYVFDGRLLLWALDRLKNDNAQREYYITDCPGILRGDGRNVLALDCLQPCEALSINNPADLAEVEVVMREMAAAGAASVKTSANFSSNCSSAKSAPTKR